MGQLHKRYKRRTTHGGLQKRGAKLERPLSTKKWIHLVLKSDQAVGSLSFLRPKNKKIVERILRDKSQKFHVRIADAVNMGNHLHLKIKIKHREGFRNFLRSVTTLIARGVTGARKGRRFGRFWQGTAFTRVLLTQFEELGLKGYFAVNREECQNGYAARAQMLHRFNRWLYRLKYLENTA